MADAQTSPFLKNLRASGLLSTDQLAEIEQWPSAAGHDDQALARELVDRGLLTEFQAERVLAGHTQGFLIGPYTILDRIGAGGMGQVYKAMHRHMQRTVALKVLPRSRRTDPVAQARFLREARASAQLNHPNIVRAYDVGEESGVTYLVMEYVEGIDLLGLIRAHGKLDPCRAATIAWQAALGLEHARRRGIVHRDIKPSNILIDNTGCAKILDMGLARIKRDDTNVADSTRLTRDGVAMGTVDYLSPEQAMDSHSVDTRADIYSLGCTLYHMLTGQVPFPGKTVAGKLMKHQMHEPEPLTKLAPDVPADLGTVVTKMMSKQVGNRYQTPAEVAEALLPWVQSSDLSPGSGVWQTPAPSGAPSVSSPTTPPRSGADVAAAPSERAEPSVRRRLPEWAWVPIAVGALAVLTALVTVAVLFWLKPGTFTNSLGMEMVYVKPGTFMMGSPLGEEKREADEGPQHRVAVTKAFYLGAHEVTVGQFRAFVEATGYRTDAERGDRAYQRGRAGGSVRSPDGKWRWSDQATWKSPGLQQADSHPVVMVSWSDAHAFCRWLSTQEGRRYRLPTEAEWEYACRAGSTTTHCFGEADAHLGAYAWYGSNAKNTTHSVGRKHPNAWGLHDMHGNVWEWCQDWYGQDYYGTSRGADPQGPDGGEDRVTRGGSWGNLPNYCRSADRNSLHAAIRADHIGFRVVYETGSLAAARRKLGVSADTTSSGGN